MNAGDLTAEEIRALLRECVTIVKPGETLIVRVPLEWTASQVSQYQENATSRLDLAGAPFKIMVVPGEELGVALPWAWPGGLGAPIQPVPIDEPPGGWRPEPRKWRYHVGGTCATPQADGTCGCGKIVVVPPAAMGETA